VFARRIRVEYEDENNGQRSICPMKWARTIFLMRNFTNATPLMTPYPSGGWFDGIGSKVRWIKLQAAMEDWFQRKSYIPKQSKLVLTPKD